MQKIWKKIIRSFLLFFSVKKCGFLNYNFYFGYLFFYSENEEVFCHK